MNRLILLSLFLIFFLSCRDSSNVRKSEIMSDDEFISIMIDFHKAEGVISIMDLRNKNKSSDSLSLYNYILKKHNISRLKFSKTVQYYSLHIQEYNQFYDSVLNYFTVLQENLKLDIEKEIQDNMPKKDTSNLWNLKYVWELPKDGKTNPIAFNIDAKNHGIYVLKASIRIFPDDQSVNLRMTIIANYEDGSKDLNTIGAMIKDGQFEPYEVSIVTDKNKKLKSISGWLLDHSKGTVKKHISVKDIELKRTKE